jgi:hypothetical protein
MIGSRAKSGNLLTVIFALIVVIGLPTLVAAQGRGHGHGRGQDKKAEKFKNGHDARDGRWDGRGPRHDRDDDFDDDIDDRLGRGRRHRDRDDDINDRASFGRRAVTTGYRHGYNAGRNDRANGERFNYRDESAYRDATSGYGNSHGDINLYRSDYREGFRRGYEDGYRNRTSRGALGGILGDILGRP